MPSSPDAAEVCFRLQLSAMMSSTDLQFSGVLGLLRKFTADATSSTSRRLRFFLRHALFLMESGDELYADCSIRHYQSSRPILVAHRVAKEREEGIIRTTLKLADWSMSSRTPLSTTSVFAAYAGKVEMIVHRGPVIVDRVVQAADIPTRVAPLQADEIEAFYEHRRTVQAVETSTMSHATWRLAKRVATENDEIAVAKVCASAFEFDASDKGKILQGRAVQGVCRKSHPYIGATLHVLPRLIEAPESMSVLQSLAADLPNISEAGFDSILLGVVDTQSTEFFHSEEDDGVVRPYVNNHGYWSSGGCGIDPVLGEERDYVALAETASKLRIRLIQDSVFGTLGYPPQLPRLASPSSGCTSSMLFLGDQPAPIFKDGLFLRDLESCEAIPSASGDCLEEFIKTVTRMHLGEYYRLPRPNIFCPKVLSLVLRRARWQIRKAGVPSFRIDMAKHIGIDPLRTIVATLREEAREHRVSDLPIIMEYATVNYRDLRFALASMEPANDQVYFYDFPLARALQRVLLEGEDWLELLSEVVDQRNVWQVPALCLVPVFIDHDPSFRPIYNGSAMTRDIVVAGLTMAIAMSANGPSVYCAYDNREAAPAELKDYSKCSEQYARRPVRSPLSYDSDGPGRALKELLEATKRHGVLTDWNGMEMTFAGDKNHLRISRTLGTSANPREAIFCLSRGGGAAAMGEQRERLVFASGCGPSVALFIRQDVKTGGISVPSGAK